LKNPGDRKIIFNLVLKTRGFIAYPTPCFKSKINVRVKDNICSTPSRLKKLRH
jgi:hypothetical protein